MEDRLILRFIPISMSIKLKANTWAKAEKMVSIFRRHNANVEETDKQTRQTVAGGFKRGFFETKKKYSLGPISSWSTQQKTDRLAQKEIKADNAFL